MGSSTDTGYFYIYAVLLIAGAAGVVFSPRMFAALCSFFFMLLFSSLIYGLLNAAFLAVFQFVLCGLMLCLMLFFILKKITIWMLPLKIASIVKIMFAIFVFCIFAVVSFFYVGFEFGSNSGLFIHMFKEKSADIIDFSGFLFSVSLAVILTLTVCVALKNIELTKTENLPEYANEKEGSQNE